jgi:CubicO group peptidase (beta-lactamase class C family)
VTERLLEPLGMGDSGVGDAGGGDRLTGYAEGRAVEHWDHALPGLGEVECTAEDLGRYLTACLSPPDAGIGAAIRLTQMPRVRVDEHLQVGLAWMRRDEHILWHNGGTGGFAASVGIQLAERRALGILVNTHGRVVPVLDAAVLLALTGGDVARARPGPRGSRTGAGME